jgi:4-aminobutyrate aminotransferase-like enzyme
MHMVNSFDPTASESLAPEDRALLERRQRVLGAPYRLFYREPVHLVRSEGVLLYDRNGLDYLDAYNNVPVVGHSNPRVQERVAQQLSVLNTHTRYLTDDVVDYAERLLALFPPHLEQVVFACTGSEAVDLALRIAGHTTGRTGIIATAHAYHGTTQAAAAVSPSLGTNNPIPDNVVLVEAPDTLRHDPATTAREFAARITRGIDELRRRGHQPAAAIVDSILSSDGLQTDPPGMLGPAAEVVRDAGALWIADEVQSGFGRTGGWWGFERHALRPDLVVLGKPMGNGIPISAVVGRADLMEAFGRDVRYFNTFGGNPVSIAAASAVLDEITGLDLLHNATTTGAEAALGMSGAAAGDPGIADVRHAGLFIAVELVRDPETLAPDAARAAAIVDAMRQRRVLISASGRYDNVLKVRPPLTLSSNELPRLLEAFDESVRVTRTSP